MPERVSPSQWDDEWERYLEGARDADERVTLKVTWVPPMLSALAEAVHATTLRRFLPFNSVNNMCLATGPRFYVMDDDDDEAPAHVGLYREEDDNGHNLGRGVYVVISGRSVPRPSDSNEVTLTTSDPQAAAREFERLLVGWL